MKNISFTTRDQARAFARIFNAIAPAKLKAPVKEGGVWVFPRLTHADNKGTLNIKKRKRISNYALDCFTLKVMALSVNKSWSDKHFNEVIKCAKAGMSAEDAAKEIDKINV